MGEMLETFAGVDARETTVDESVFDAKEPSRALTRITIRGTNIKLKQPLPSSCWAAAV
jgi:hypothetical protein